MTEYLGTVFPLADFRDMPGNCGMTVIEEMDTDFNGEQLKEFLEECDKVTLFTDSSEERNGLPLARALRKKGYRVDQFNLGKSPVTGNNLWLYVLYPNKRVAQGKKKSIIQR